MITEDTQTVTHIELDAVRILSEELNHNTTLTELSIGCRYIPKCI